MGKACQRHPSTDWPGVLVQFLSLCYVFYQTSGRLGAAGHNPTRALCLNREESP
jgi:hypothetical protein